MGEAGRSGGEADVVGLGKHGEEELLGGGGHAAGKGAAELEAAAFEADDVRFAAGGAKTLLAIASLGAPWRSRPGAGLLRFTRNDGSGLSRLSGAGEADLGGLEGGFPEGGEGGVPGAALGEGGAVEAEFAGGETGVAGAGEGFEEAAILGALCAGEGSGSLDWVWNGHS
jgi:hypothetical protein